MDLKLVTEISKCLANQTRIEILEWLKNPAENFPPHTSIDHYDDGVCATYIYEKSGLSQSTISNYLTNMEKCGLLVLTRHGKWSYFKRNQEVINEYTEFLK
ncbi:ArsR/SmtB family transcription factor [Portibacter lacus]|uniref:Transcriptional regulator n=1 Tax=Portibacter lacus TaxID=1099794 RepID=A0AA37WFT7_9BACT|nr:helix-turn-helix domain-containing protein [Portibacter lacus]GLR19108.1 transcriptional regulator [Portibacter lacus]